jgi:hypothetical protein
MSGLARMLAVTLLVAACTSGKEAGSSQSVPPSPVTGLEIAKSTDSEVDLRWTLPTSPIDGLIVMRNKNKVASLGEGTTQFMDGKVDPGTHYVYQVLAKAGALMSTPARAATKTPVPPTSEARLEGTYAMTFTLLSSNITNPGPSVTKGKWRLTPLCGKGPCDAKMESISGKYEVRLAWIPSAQHYRGAVQRKSFFGCGTVNLDATAQVTVDADNAKVISGSWVATQIRGQVVYDQSENGSCFPQAHEALAIHGTLSK